MLRCITRAHRNLIRRKRFRYARANRPQADFSMRRLKTVAVAGRLIGPNGGPKMDW